MYIASQNTVNEVYLIVFKDFFKVSDWLSFTTLLTSDIVSNDLNHYKLSLKQYTL